MYPPPMNDAHSIRNKIVCIQISIKLSLPWPSWVFIHFIITFILRISFEVAVNKSINTRFLLFSL
jgi:hypothetical protein